VDSLTKFGSLFIVADGVGGASKGEKASEYAAKKVLHEYFADSDGDPVQRLTTAIRGASRDIYEFSQRDEAGGQMATTFVAALVVGDQLYVANVGDSRAYLLHNGSIRQITRDHSYTGEMVEEGVLTEAEAMHTKGKNRLTRSVGGDSSVKVDVFPTIPLTSGDHIILCTDGLTRYALKEDIQKMASTGNVDEIAGRLIDFANNSGGADNVTVMVVEVGQPLSQAADTVIVGLRIPPAAVDWDSMVTEHSIRGPVRVHPRRKKLLLWIILAVVALVILAGATGWLAINNWQKFRASILPTIIPTAIPVVIPQTPTASVQPTATTAHTAIPTQTPTIEQGTPTIQTVECLLQQQQIVYLSAAVKAMGYAYDKNEQYYYRLCSQNSGIPTKCDAQILISDHDHPNGSNDPGYFFSFSEIDSNLCSTNGGTPWSEPTVTQQIGGFHD